MKHKFKYTLVSHGLQRPKSVGSNRPAAAPAEGLPAMHAFWMLLGQGSCETGHALPSHMQPFPERE